MREDDTRKIARFLYDSDLPTCSAESRQIRLLTASFHGRLRTWSFDESKQTITKQFDDVGVLDTSGGKISRLVKNQYDTGVVLAVANRLAIVSWDTLDLSRLWGVVLNDLMTPLCY
jgi:hypothetical protein